MSFCGDVKFRQQIISLLYSRLLDVSTGNSSFIDYQFNSSYQYASLLNLPNCGMDSLVWVDNTCLSSKKILCSQF